MLCLCILASSRIPRYDLGRQTLLFRRVLSLECPAPPVKLVSHAGQTDLRVPGQQRTFKPKSSEKWRWKTDERSSQYKKFRANPTFDLLLNKYTRQATVLKNQPREKHLRSPQRQEIDKMQQREDTQRRERVQHKHPWAAPSVSQAANHPAGADLTFYPPFPPIHMLINQCCICHLSSSSSTQYGILIWVCGCNIL
jgi:hypothetical protein